MAWRMSVNERKFIETALASDLRVDGRRPFDYRRLNIKFGRSVFVSCLTAYAVIMRYLNWKSLFLVVGCNALR